MCKGVFFRTLLVPLIVSSFAIICSEADAQPVPPGPPAVPADCTVANLAKGLFMVPASDKIGADDLARGGESCCEPSRFIGAWGG
jgi:hypothetical protein